VVAGARARGFEISIPQLFQLPVLGDLAAAAGPIAGATTQRPSVAPFALVSAADGARLPAGLEDAYPLAQLQTGMLFHSELGADTAVYHDILSFHVEAPFSAAAFQSAVDELVQRHPLLRTSFDLSSYGEPLQLVHASVPLPVVVHDLRGLDDDACRRRLAAVVEDERQRPIDWTRAPLVRVCVCLTGEQRFRVTIGLHHAILDGWSVATAVAELLQAYRARLDGRPAALLPPPALGYRDFVALEREAVASADARRFWLQQRDAITPQQLPRWWPARGGRRQVQVHEIPGAAQLTDGVKRLATQLHVPVKTVLLAAHLHAQSVLHGGPEVLTGLVANGRPEAADGERLLGLFLNTLPLRQRVDVPSWVELIRETFAAEAALLPVRRFPLAEIQRLVGKGALFDVAFNYLHFHRLRAAVDESAFQIFDDELVVETNFTLLIEATLTVGTDQLKLALWYDTLEIDPRQVDAISEVYRRTLTAMIADVEAPPLHRARLVAEQQPRRALHAAEASPLAPVHRLAEAQAARTPDATAVLGGDGTLSYRALDEAANRLAHVLRDRGVGPDSRVALCLDRATVALPVAVLATLKAGASYVPLDASYPAERLGFMLDDSRARVLLSERARVASLARDGVQVLALDELALQLEQAPSTPPKVSVGLDDLAYVIYTSGSTGRPKGVAMSHRPLAELVRWQCASSRLAPGARTLQFAPLSFDVSFQELFATWCAGGTIVLVDDETRRDPIALHRLVRRREIARLFLPVVALQQLAEVGDREPPPSSLREVITAGEQLQVTPALRALFASLPQCTLENQYGPSETHVVTAQRLRGAPRDWVALPPIGVAVAGAAVELLDRHGRPVPTGVAGELFISGDAVSRGYLERPELTADRYQPRPGGGRAYRTGDLARRNGDGVIEFLGRADEQVKVRGHRIELGEVEAALNEHPGVARCAVAVREQAGRKLLVAYVVVAAPPPTVEELRSFLQARLPEYMTPSSFAFATALPLTPSGKVDRRALPALAAQLATLPGNDEVTPRGPLETLLAGIFAAVLGVDRVGAHDNFLALGGNSLSIVQAVLRVRDALEVELPLRSVFKAPTVAELAAELGDAIGDRARLERIAELTLEIEQLSDAEVEQRLANARPSAERASEG
jgi:amino acid adenylation domain-containing protein